MLLDGIVIYEGPSKLDGKDIAGIITGLKGTSLNSATGPMAQLWIVPDRVSPVKSVTTRRSFAYSVCGDCRHSGVSCYVQEGKAPTQVWNSWKRGRYGNLSGVHNGEEALVECLKDVELRLGAWGDPLALPVSLLKLCINSCLDWTGYTHQWNNPAFELENCEKFLMASVDSKEERKVAKLKGWVTYRVTSDINSKESSENLCPGKVKGSKITCYTCRMKCKGNAGKGKDILVEAHGATRLNFLG